MVALWAEQWKGIPTMTVNHLSHKEIAQLDADDKTIVTHGFEILSAAIAANNYEKGWREPNTPLDQTRSVGDLIALLHSEVTEAFEAYRNKEPDLWYEHNYTMHDENGAHPMVSDKDSPFADQSYLTNMQGEMVLGKPQGIASELADVLIRVLDMAEEKGIPLLQAIFDKHAYNQTRPWKHGNKAV